MWVNKSFQSAASWYLCLVTFIYTPKPLIYPVPILVVNSLAVVGLSSVPVAGTHVKTEVNVARVNCQL